MYHLFVYVWLISECWFGYSITNLIKCRSCTFVKWIFPWLFFVWLLCILLSSCVLWAYFLEWSKIIRQTKKWSNYFDCFWNLTAFITDNSSVSGFIIQLPTMWAKIFDSSFQKWWTLRLRYRKPLSISQKQLLNVYCGPLKSLRIL